MLSSCGVEDHKGIQIKVDTGGGQKGQLHPSSFDNPLLSTTVCLLIIQCMHVHFLLNDFFLHFSPELHDGIIE